MTSSRGTRLAPDAGGDDAASRREHDVYEIGTVGFSPDEPLDGGAGPSPVAREGAALEAGAYREAMARLASAVHVVTTDGPGGRAGFTASAVCSVSDAPPTLLVCLNRGFSAYPAFGRNGTLCVNTLAGDQRALAGVFGGKTPMAERFAGAAWGRLVTGAPVLGGSLVAFDCRIVDRSRVATHDVLFCEVLALSAPGAGHPLLYAGRRYHALPRHAPDEAGRD